MTVPDPLTDVWELLWTAACDYRDANPQRSEARLVDTLMPIVKEYAASEIERLADERTWTTEHDNDVVSARDLYEHVARLRGELDPVTYDFPPSDSPAPCGAYSNITDGWCCAAVGPHDEHHNAAGDVRWGAA